MSDQVTIIVQPSPIVQVSVSEQNGPVNITAIDSPKSNVIVQPGFSNPQIVVSAIEPVNPSVGLIWIDIS